MKTNLTQLLKGLVLLFGLFQLYGCEEKEPNPFPKFTITEFSPKEGRPGTIVTFTGTNFGEIPEVAHITFNGKEGVILADSYSDSVLQVIVPKEAGTGTVKVKIWDQLESVGEFNYFPGASIASVSPIQAEVGDLITIEGENFGTDPKLIEVTINKVTAEIVEGSLSNTSIQVLVPDTRTGILQLKVGPDVAVGPEFTVISEGGEIVNPSFETRDRTGWVSSHQNLTWNGVNDDGDETKTGNFITGIWHPDIPDYELSQTVTGLKNGLYTVSADLFVGATTAGTRLTTQRIFAGNKSTLFGAESAYSEQILSKLRETEEVSFAGHQETVSDRGPFVLTEVVEVEVTDGTLTLGVRTNGDGSTLIDFPTGPNENGGRGWFKVDNFQLTYLGPVVE